MFLLVFVVLPTVPFWNCMLLVCPHLMLSYTVLIYS